eukprot:13998621-Alexandrium_andersonii.AAC.1
MVAQLVEGDDADPSLHRVTELRWQLSMRHRFIQLCDLSAAEDIYGGAESLRRLGFYRIGYSVPQRK